MMDALGRFGTVEGVVEDQGFDCDWHGVGGSAYSADINIVEVRQGNAVDHQYVIPDVQVFLQDRAHVECDVCVQHDEQRFAAGNTRCRAVLNPFREGSHSLV